MHSKSFSPKVSFRWFAGVIAVAAFTLCPAGVAHEEQHGKDKLDASATKEVTGEVVDLMCYLDHNALGEKHAACGSKCVKGGGPVGIVSGDKAYLVVGEHMPINDKLAEFCGK